MPKPSAATIRKQVYLLDAQDFFEHPIWEFCSDEELEDGQDEATAKPSAELEVEGYADGVYVVACDATFADGSTHPAYVYSGQPQDLGCVQPNILVPGAQVSMWFGSLRFRANPEGFLASCYGLLGGPREAIFPIQFRTRVHVNGAPLTVVVDGFKALDHYDQVITIG